MREEYSCTKGFLHVPFGWTYVHETNQRKSFHFHCAVHAGASPALLADVAGFDTLEQAVYRALDSIYKAQVPPEVHALDIARRPLKVPAVKLSYIQNKGISTAAESTTFEIGAAITAVTTGFSHTCIYLSEGDCW